MLEECKGNEAGRAPGPSYLDGTSTVMFRDGWGRLRDVREGSSIDGRSVGPCRQLHDENGFELLMVHAPLSHQWVTPLKTAATIHAVCSSACIVAAVLHGNLYSLRDDCHEDTH